MNKKMRKNEKKEKDKKREKKKWEKKEKMAQRGLHLVHTPRDGPKKCFFTEELSREIVIVKRNRNEIEAQKKSDFEHPTKTKKMKENEIK